MSNQIELSLDLSAVLLKTSADSKRHDYSPTYRGTANVYNLYDGDNHIKVTFVPRNIMPHLQDTDKYPGYIFTPSQPWLKEDKWIGFVSTVKENVVVAQENYTPPDSFKIEWGSLFYIYAYPTSLLTAAMALDPDNSHLRNMRDSFQKPIKPLSYGEFIDLVIAGKFINQEGNLKPFP